MNKKIYAIMAAALSLGLSLPAGSANAEVVAQEQTKRQLKVLDQQIRQQAAASLRQAATQELLRFLKSPEALQTQKLRSHIRQLVQSGADVNAQDKDGNSVFNLTLRTGDADSVKFLVRKGIDFKDVACPSAGTDYLTALARKSLCKDGKAQPSYLAFESDVELAQFFRGRSEKAAQPSVDALVAAAEQNNETLTAYYAQWFDVNRVRQETKRTALHEMALRNDLEGVVLLLNQGANPFMKDAEGKTPADLTTDRRVRAVLQLEGEELRKNFPLHRAVRKNDVKTTVDLIYAGADVNEQLDSDGRTPLIEAARFNRQDAVLVLIANGADLNKTAFNGNTPLHYVVLQGNFSMLKLLVEKGANVNVANAEGDTPLHYAVRHAHHRMAQYLKKNGARMDIKNKGGVTAAQIEAQQALERNRAYTQQVKWNLRFE